MPTLQEFASVCNESQSAGDVAEKLGITVRRVVVLASEARRAGLDVKSLRRKSRKRLNGPGDKFGRLVVVGEEFYATFWGGSRPWLVCRCECGTVDVYSRQGLRSGSTTSCGCSRIEQVKAMATKHGRSATRLYRIWSLMKQRCFNQKSMFYRYYGGRGISVCNEWAESFLLFAAWAESSGYQKHLEIDRKDSNGNYCPENCRWASRSQQMQNTRKRKDAKTSRYKGVFWCSKSQRWVVRVTTNGRVRHVGHYQNEVDAARAYKEAAEQDHGEYACTNFSETEVCDG